MTSGPDLHTISHAVTRLWEQLGGVSALSFFARSGKGAAGWNGAGEGTVEVDKEKNTIVFREAGEWKTATGQLLPFRNVFRWTLISAQNRIKLEHLRYGAAQPVYLFDLVARTDAEFVSAAPHLCAADVYTGQLTLNMHAFTLDWYIKGPRKDEHIRYVYT